MSTAQWLVMLHITAAFFYVSGSVAAGILNVLAIRAERPSESAYLLRLVRVTLPVIGVGVAGTLVFGLWLWHERGYSFGAAWIWAALVLWVIAGALGGIGGRHQERSRKLAEQLAASGDTSTDELRALLRDSRGNAISWLAGAATIAILVLMIWKPGS
ncbi:MAG: DUF2269 family protein [Thermoleophilia bacterium]|nr:DUF2269 family protein [Thermoleophilia bacterium]